MTKREFLKTSLLASAGVLATPLMATDLRAFPGRFPPATAPQYGLALFPFLWADDLAELLHLSPAAETKDETIRAINTNREYFQFGRSWDVQPDRALELLTESRDLLRADKSGTDRAKTQFALVAGWVAARVLDHELAATDLSEDLAIALDTHLLRDRHEAAGGTVTASVDELTEAFALMRHRNLLRLHTFRPEFSDGDGWLDGFLAYHDALDASNARYAAAYVNPPTELRPRIASLYQATDAPIQLAGALRRGELTTLVGQSEKLLNGTVDSAYGRALREGFTQLRVLGSYVEGRGAGARVEEVLKETSGR